MAGDDEETHARFNAALALLNMEGVRLFSTFSAFLVTEALIGGFLVNLVARDLTPWFIVGGAFLGLSVAVLWTAAFLRHTKAYNWRMALARRT